ncbi:MAG: class I SAM-dependent methyltransferase [Sedimentisphaerales bacterium]
MRKTQKQKKKLWYEDKSLWKTVAPILFNQKRLEQTGSEVEQLIRLCGIRKGTKVLDLCCGQGRHSLELARRGYNVTGVDLTEEYLAKARRKAKAEGLNIQFIRDDMRRFCLLDYFDAAINMFTAFGYFENPAEDRRVLANLYRSLRKGGTLIIDVIGKEILARIFREREWYEENGRIFLQEHKIRRDWSWVDNRWILFENGKRKEFRFGHRIYSAAELTGLLKDCGFKSVEIFGDLAGADYDHNAKRLIAVAKK